MQDQEFTPKIVGFLCNWCSYTAADTAGVSRLQMPPSVMVVRVMCSGRVDPLFVFSAFLRGADGVLVAGCWPGQCHYQKGNFHARRRAAMVESIFETLGLEMIDRFRLSWISASEAPRFAEVAKGFTEEVEQLGPSPIWDKVFL